MLGGHKEFAFPDKLSEELHSVAVVEVVLSLVKVVTCADGFFFQGGLEKGKNKSRDMTCWM